MGDKIPLASVAHWKFAGIIQESDTEISSFSCKWIPFSSQVSISILVDNNPAVTSRFRRNLIRELLIQVQGSLLSPSAATLPRKKIAKGVPIVQRWRKGCLAQAHHLQSSSDWRRAQFSCSLTCAHASMMNSMVCGVATAQEFHEPWVFLVLFWLLVLPYQVLLCHC